MGAVNIILAVVMAVFTTVAGEVYHVGDSDGWTSTNGHPDYQKWAATKKFLVGDKIVFHYDQQSDNVARVTLQDFKTCNATKPYSLLTTGDDTFTLTFPGHFFFICTHPDHCQSGQKVNIRVLPGSTPPPPSAVSPSPIQPLPFPYPQPQAPSHSPATMPTSPAPAQTPATPALPEDSPAPALHEDAPAPALHEDAPAPALHEDAPAPSVVVSAPKIAPSVPKSDGSQLGFGFKIWTMVVMVGFYPV